MADPDLSPLPFRRERNLSNRNFNKRNSRRRISQQAAEQERHPSTNMDADGARQRDSAVSSSSSSFQLSYSVNSDTESAFQRRSLLKLREPEVEVEGESAPQTPMTPTTPDPAWLDVRQKVQRFETLKTTIGYLRQERHSLKLLENRRRPSFEDHAGEHRTPPATPPRRIRLPGLAGSRSSSIPSTPGTTNSSISEVRSEDEVDQISDFETDPHATREYVLAESASEVLPSHAVDPEDESSSQQVQRSISVDQPAASHTLPLQMRNDQDFPRNYRSTPRRKTEIIGTTNQHLVGKFHSLYQPKDEEEEVEIELRDKSDKCVHPILEELVKTEEAYVNNLYTGIENYGNIFQRKDLPQGLRGKKYDLFGNIEQIAEFHRDEFLPMLQRNKRDLKRLFDEFLQLLDQNCFYGYVIFTMNKQNSLKLCDLYKNYFTNIRLERDDKLGINSFLVQPIQRMARYPLLLTQFINTFFKNRDIVMKPLIESCCRLEKRLRTLLTTTNESEIINDIVGCHEFNVFYQGKFRKVNEFQIFDCKQKRSYRAKVFIFDKCIIYTEIKGKQLLFHGRYPCEHIGISAKTKSFTLYYERRKQQECEFTADPAQISHWLDLIRDMINNYANEERQKLHELYGRENDHLHRKPPSFSLYRDSNRFSTDSGIGNIWIMPKPDEETASNRSTWYANS
ncbi:triple functional domain protein isoform X1 [Drosophila persimilis]|uniref:Triple functional domain protein isoform X1 n=3 Tax=pseudoobscura subgroup TaxID=32358 RepID=A0A6I8VSD0_DROPS|nr:triple functional domain protein isoform X1 [Drosophila pseudoobscura]XP_002017579.2 triple functional domain protein isoform X1 [Drosophila persimilis]XP_033233991.1 triple functional domain protein isoform X1 [Drosophila pseudoobscura]